MLARAAARRGFARALGSVPGLGSVPAHDRAYPPDSYSYHIMDTALRKARGAFSRQARRVRARAPHCSSSSRAFSASISQ